MNSPAFAPALTESYPCRGGPRALAPCPRSSPTLLGATEEQTLALTAHETSCGWVWGTPAPAWGMPAPARGTPVPAWGCRAW